MNTGSRLPPRGRKYLDGYFSRHSMSRRIGYAAASRPNYANRAGMIAPGAPGGTSRLTPAAIPVDFS